MTDNRITPLTRRKQPPSTLLDRARTGRRSALADRMVTIIQTSTPDGAMEEHRFPGTPRIVDLIARLGADAFILGVRTERLDNFSAQRPTYALR